MIRTAAKRELAASAHDAEVGTEPSPMPSVTSAALSVRLAAARKRLADADLQRHEAYAAHSMIVQGQSDELSRLQAAVSDLQSRTRAYNRALNEAASLVDEMDKRLLFFEQQFGTALAVTGESNPVRRTLVADQDDIPEADVARDLDWIRAGGSAVRPGWPAQRKKQAFRV